MRNGGQKSEHRNPFRTACRGAPQVNRFILITLLCVSCATPVAPRTAIMSGADFSGRARVMLSSNHSYDRIRKSLVLAGIEQASIREANVIVDVTIGGPRSSGDSSCGRIANIRYVVRVDARIVANIVGRGPTGECEENIVDQMSASLAELLQ